MKRILMATILAASALGWTGSAMAAHTTKHDDVDQSRETYTRWGGSSEASFGQQSAAQYNQANGE